MNCEEGNKIEVEQDTVVGWTLQGGEIEASRLQMWAYRRLDAFPELLDALKAAENWLVEYHDPENSPDSGLSGLFEQVRAALTRAEGAPHVQPT